MKDVKYGFHKLLLYTERDSRKSYFLVSLLPEAIENGMPRIGEKRRFIGEIITIKATDVSGETTYSQEYLVHTII